MAVCMLNIDRHDWNNAALLDWLIQYFNIKIVWNMCGEILNWQKNPEMILCHSQTVANIELTISGKIIVDLLLGFFKLTSVAPFTNMV